MLGSTAHAQTAAVPPPDHSTATGEPALLPDPASEPAEANPKAREGAVAARKAAETASQRTEQVLANMAAVREILSIGVSGEGAGELLREARARAPEPSVLRWRLEDLERSRAEARIDRVRLLEQRRFAMNAGDAAEARRLSGELGDQQAYLDALVSAVAAEKLLYTQSLGLVELLDRHLLWIGSAPPISRAWAVEVVTGFGWATRPAAWVDVGGAAFRGAGTWAITSVLWTLVTGGLFFGRLALKRRLEFLSRGIGRVKTDHYFLTWRALIVTVLLALPLPLTIAGPSLAVLAGQPDGFAQDVAYGGLAAAGVALALGFFAAVCRPNGLADAHFHWNTAARNTLWRHLRRLMVVETPVALVVAATDAGGHEGLRGGLGRAAFLVGSVALTVFVCSVFRPDRGVLNGLLTPGGWAWRLRKLAWVGLTAIPAVLTAAAALGYYYTATEVLSRFFTSGVVLLIGTLAYSLASRYVSLARRRVAMEQALKRLSDTRNARRAAEAAAKPDAAPASSVASGEAEPELDEAKIDVEAVGGQTRTLLLTLVGFGVAVALSGVWADLLPALSGLKQISFSKSTLGPGGELIAADLNLWSVSVFVFVLFLTWVAARNLPAVAELVILERVPIDAGVRYAATTLLRYAIVATGALAATRAIGFDWSQAQWIIAALGVGLGFRPAGDRCQLRVRSHRPGRTARPRGRHRHGRQRHGHRQPAGDPRHHHHRLRQQRGARPQQGLHHRSGGQLDADQPRDASAHPHRCRLRERRRSRTHRHFLRCARQLLRC